MPRGKGAARRPPHTSAAFWVRAGADGGNRGARSIPTAGVTQHTRDRCGIACASAPPISGPPRCCGGALGGMGRFPPPAPSGSPGRSRHHFGHAGCRPGVPSWPSARLSADSRGTVLPEARCLFTMRLGSSVVEFVRHGELARPGSTPARPSRHDGTWLRIHQVKSSSQKPSLNVAPAVGIYLVGIYLVVIYILVDARSLPEKKIFACTVRASQGLSFGAT